jgi:hypothetical protein
MKLAIIFLALAGLAACDTGLPAASSAPASSAPQKHQPAEPGVSVSGYARAGVSHTF